MKKLILIILLIAPLFVHAQVIVRVAGGGSVLGDGGPAIDAAVFEPYYVYKSAAGNLYIYDNTRRIRMVDTAGIIHTICGDGTAGYLGDGGPARLAEIVGYTDFAVDSIGNLYFTDAGNQCVRKIDTTGFIYTVVGTGVEGYGGDGGHADSAQLNYPTGLVFDKKGNLYIQDFENYRIRKVDTAGIITTIAGTGVSGFSPDGSRADTAMLNANGNIKMDKYGNLYFSDNVRIRRIDTLGILTTLAGNGIIGYAGDGGLAINAQVDAGQVALDTFGNIFITDADDSRIRKINTAGIITTVAGDGVAGATGDGGSPLLAELCSPAAISVAANGDIYIGNICGAVRKVTLDTPTNVPVIYSQNADLSVYPDPSPNHFTVELSSQNTQNYTIVITDVMGSLLKQLEGNTNTPLDVHTNLPPGVYFIRATTSNQRFSKKIIIL